MIEESPCVAIDDTLAGADGLGGGPGGEGGALCECGDD